MQGTIIKIAVTEGQQVSAGDTVVVLEAMKMEQPLTAHKDGTVTGLSVEVGQTVSAGAAICELTDARLRCEQAAGRPGLGRQALFAFGARLPDGTGSGSGTS